MTTRNLVRALRAYEHNHPDDGGTASALPEWVGRSGDEELWRINAFRLADALGVNGKKLLETFIALTYEGIFELNWDFHCTECNARAGSHRHLGKATSVNHCPLCDVDFRNDLIRNVAVTFTPSPRYYAVAVRFLNQQSRRTVELHRAKQIRMPEPYVRGIDCLHVPLFREKFEAETLSLRESLRVGQVCIMFTDIKGSTALYDRLGDSAAYGLVRNHFEVLFEKIAENDGVVVKTIGDSVMASFKQPVDGVKAALAIQQSFRLINERQALQDEILVKIGLHSGSTIMVNLNNRIDYFGQTVNMAARVQSSADGGEVLVSEAVRRDAASVAALRGRVASLTKKLVVLKGIRGSRPIYRLNFPVPRPDGALKQGIETDGARVSPAKVAAETVAT